MRPVQHIFTEQKPSETIRNCFSFSSFGFPTRPLSFKALCFRHLSQTQSLQKGLLTKTRTEVFSERLRTKHFKSLLRNISKPSKASDQTLATAQRSRSNFCNSSVRRSSWIHVLALIFVFFFLGGFGFKRKSLVKLCCKMNLKASGMPKEEKTVLAK